MPAQKRSHETPPPASAEPEEKDDDSQPNQDREPEELDDEDDSDGSPSSSGGDKEDLITVKLSEIRKEVQCPICLGIIRKTRTVMECLHRFCRECIDKSMRLGNNECPACRTHCASRRSLRDDPNYDALIAVLYPDIDKYEEEELAFHEEEVARNKQIQASISQTLRRQTEALGRKRTARATAAAFVRRSQSGYRNLRGRRNHRTSDNQGSDNEDDANGHDAGKDSSSADERCTDVRPKRYRRWGGARFSQTSAAASADAGSDDNDPEMNRELLGASAGLVGSSEILAWGKGGMRSNTRHGSLAGGNGKLARNSRLSKLMDSLRFSSENDDELDISIMLLPLREEDMPSLQRPYLCCRPTSSVGHLSKYVALQTSMQADEIDMLIVKELHPTDDPVRCKGEPSLKSMGTNLCKNELHILEDHQKLGEIQAMCNFGRRNLILAYRRKVQELGNS